MRIGMVAREAGVSVDTVRYYEKEGRPPTAARSAARYRLYPPTAIERLQFIDCARALGFSLVEIRELLMIGEQPNRDMGSLRAQIAAKMRLVRAKIAELERIRGALERLHRQCPGPGPLGECPVLTALEMDSASIASRPLPSRRPSSRQSSRKCARRTERPSKRNSRSRP
jgi:DNA-binding transcriptional MerR regulator